MRVYIGVTWICLRHLIKTADISIHYTSTPAKIPAIQSIKIPLLSILPSKIRNIHLHAFTKFTETKTFLKEHQQSNETEFVLYHYLTPRNIDQRETTKLDLLSMAERFRFQRHQRSCPFDWFNHCAFHENIHRKQWLYIQEPEHVWPIFFFNNFFTIKKKATYFI